MGVQMDEAEDARREQETEAAQAKQAAQLPRKAQAKQAAQLPRKRKTTRLMLHKLSWRATSAARRGSGTSGPWTLLWRSRR